MAHNSKRFIAVSLPGERVRIKRSRHRTREDRVAPLHLRRGRDRVGTTFRYSRREKRYAWGGCPDCLVLMVDYDFWRPRHECDTCEAKSDIQYDLWTWNVPKSYRKGLTRQLRARERAITGRWVTSYTLGVDPEDTDGRRYEFPHSYHDAAYRYF